MSDDFKEKYINPFTDYGFKRLFGEEPSKDLLVDFLNELLSGEQGRIKKLTYLKSDRLGTSEEERKAFRSGSRHNAAVSGISNCRPFTP